MTIADCEILNDAELAKKVKQKERWIQSWRRSKVDPIPALRFGKSYRYAWGSPELNEWLLRRLNSRRVVPGTKKAK